MPSAITTIFGKDHLKETKARRLIVEALQKAKKPLSPYDIQKWIAKHGENVNAVTIYRFVELLLQRSIVHRHPSSGQFLLCAMPQMQGCHAFLQCQGCGKIEEFHNEKLCQMQNTVAIEAGLRPAKHVTEIIGMCAACDRTQ